MLIRKASTAQDSEITSKNNVILKGINFLNNARSASLFESEWYRSETSTKSTYADMQILFSNRSRSPLSVEFTAALEISSRSTLSQQARRGGRGGGGAIGGRSGVELEKGSCTRSSCIEVEVFST